MITRILWTQADGSILDDSDGLATEASLQNLAVMTRDTLRAAYPMAKVNVERVAELGGAVRELRAWTANVYEVVSSDDLDKIRSVAGKVWADGRWTVQA